MSARRQLSAETKFAVIPEWILYSGVRDRALRLYAVLARHADNNSGEAYPSRRRLAELLGGVHAKTIDRATKELLAIEAITVRRRYLDSGEPTSNLYTVRVSPPGGSDRTVPTPGHGCPDPSDTAVPTGRDTDVARTRTTLNENQENENQPTLSHARGSNDVPSAADVERVAKAISRATDDAPVSRSLRERIGKLVDSHDVDELVGLIEHDTSWLGLKPPLMVEFLEEHAGQRSTSSIDAASPSTRSDVDHVCQDCGLVDSECECVARSGVWPVPAGGP